MFIETRSLPSSLGAYPRAFAFYLAHPVRSIRIHSWLVLSAQGGDKMAQLVFDLGRRCYRVRDFLLQ
jgi:hypothetical protein